MTTREVFSFFFLFFFFFFLFPPFFFLFPFSLCIFFFSLPLPYSAFFLTLGWKCGVIYTMAPFTALPIPLTRMRSCTTLLEQ